MFEAHKMIDELYKIGAIQFGQFKLKSGLISPFYIDLRLIISYPSLLKELSDLIWSKAKHLGIDLICGVPYTALPIATCLSVFQNIPMIMKRKESKDYGNKKMVEGLYKEGSKCLILEDIVTSGSSILETITPLEDLGIHVENVITIINREQGGMQNIEKYGYRVQSLLSISDILKHLLLQEKITEKQANLTYEFIHENQLTV